jgi:hypothetical protein
MSRPKVQGTQLIEQSKFDARCARDVQVQRIAIESADPGDRIAHEFDAN